MSDVPSHERIQARLARRVHLRVIGAIAGIVFGLPLVFVGPLVLGSIFWYAWGMLVGWQPWHVIILWLCAIGIPLLFITEIRTRGGFLSRTVRDAGPGALSSGQALLASSMAIGLTGRAVVGFAANPRLSAAGLVEVFLTGPRWVLNGLRELAVAWRTRGVDRRRAAEIAGQLLGATSGVDPKTLCRPGETLADIDEVLSWLVLYGWIGLSVAMDRAYLYSESRQRL